jgi:hypothetical protein
MLPEEMSIARQRLGKHFAVEKYVTTPLLGQDIPVETVRIHGHKTRGTRT